MRNRSEFSSLWLSQPPAEKRSDSIIIEIYDTVEVNKSKSKSNSSEGRESKVKESIRLEVRDPES